jgi:hypothetical protein
MNAIESSESKGAFLPVLLLEISFALILMFQIAILLPQRDLLQKVIKQNEKGVEQSTQVQGALQKLVVDLVGASADDKDAQAIIAKYGIQVSGAPAAPAASPAK